LPLVVLMILGFIRGREAPIARSAAILAVSCAVVPMFLYIGGSPTGGVDFSMKVATLMAIAAAPLVAAAMTWMAARRWSPVFFSVVVVIALGLIQTGGYVLQYAPYRIPRPGDRYRENPSRHYAP